MRLRNPPHLARIETRCPADKMRWQAEEDPVRKENLSDLAERTQDVYERIAHQFAAQRPKSLIERPWLDRFLAQLPQGGDILDLGCGAGEPIAAYFMQQGFRVLGLDASQAMIDLARENLPDGRWHVGDMRDLDLGMQFNGVIGWNSFFHLTQDEQRDVLPRIASHLHTNGALLLSVGPEEGEVAGHVCADPVYHASLSPSEYADILNRLDMDFVDFMPEDPACFGMTLLLAHKGRQQAG